LNDEMIVELYWKRDETAIHETEKKYGAYLSKIAYNILADIEDSKESVNDTYLKAWNSIPPHRPQILSSWLGKITRRLSIDIFRKKNSQKRKPSANGASLYEISLQELEEIVSGSDFTEQQIDLNLLSDAINSWLRTLSPEARKTFVAFS